MNQTPLLAWSLGSLLCLAACGDDSGGSGGAGGDAATSTATSTGGATSATTTSTAGEGGAGGEGGGGSACLGSLPAAYDGADFEVNAAGVLALRAQLDALNAAMLAAEADPEVTPTAAELTALYEAEAPSLADGITPYYDGVVRDLFVAFEAAAGNTWAPSDPPTGRGGSFGAYIFDETGRDLRQWVEKGHFDAHFYPLAVALVASGLDRASLDALLAAYGAHPAFPGDSSADTATNPDRLAAQYAERRSPKDPGDASRPLDPDAPGPYFTIQRHFITAQVALDQGCVDEGEAAVRGILTEWERAMAATTIFYLNDATLKLTADGATAEDLASGLHGVSEAVAFLHGFSGTDQTFRTITDADIEAFLALLADPARFVVDPAGEAPDLLAARDFVADVYGFTTAEIEAFETSH